MIVRFWAINVVEKTFFHSDTCWSTFYIKEKKSENGSYFCVSKQILVCKNKGKLPIKELNNSKHWKLKPIMKDIKSYLR